MKIHKAYNIKMPKFQGGHSRYKLVVSLKFTTHTTQRHRNFIADVRATNTVRKVHNAYTTDIQIVQGVLSHYKNIMSLRFTAPSIQRYRIFRVDVRDTNL